MRSALDPAAGFAAAFPAPMGPALHAVPVGFGDVHRAAVMGDSRGGVILDGQIDRPAEAGVIEIAYPTQAAVPADPPPESRAGVCHLVVREG